MPETSRRAAEIAAEAFDLPSDQRGAFLKDACGDNPSLRTEVESLLAADAEAGSFLGRPAVRAERAPDHDPLVGTTVDGFAILRRIAVGGMGAVYEAQQANPHRRVALKLVRPGAATPNALRRFEHEAHVLARLQHPGIAQIFEAGSFDAGQGTQPFFAMELIDGQPLTHYAESCNLNTTQRLELFTDVCDAVHYAHEKGVIHRDLKPGNVLVGADGQPKVLDFGIARVTDADVQATTLHTQAGELMGTLPYMSPEQVMGDTDAVDPRSDVYALGVVLFELLSARLPHDLRDKTVLEAARIIREEEMTSLGSVSRVFRGDLDTIVARALEKEKDRRYASAAELAADLRRYLDDEPITARPPSTLYQLRKFAKRNRILVAGFVAVFLALTGGIIASSRLAMIAQYERARAEAKAERLSFSNGWLRELLGGTRVGSFLYDDGKLESLADVIQNSDRPSEVEPLLRKAVETYRQTLRDQGVPAVAAQLYLNDAMSRHGVLLLRLGRPVEAVRVFRQVLESDLLSLDSDFVQNDPGHAYMRSITPPDEWVVDDSPDMIGSFGNLAAALRDAGELDASESLFLRAIELAERVWPSGFVETAHIRSGYGACLTKLRRFDEAEAELLAAYGVLSADEEKPPTTRTLRRIIELYDAWGKPGNAAQWRAKLSEPAPMPAPSVARLSPSLSR